MRSQTFTWPPLHGVNPLVVVNIQVLRLQVAAVDVLLELVLAFDRQVPSSRTSAKPFRFTILQLPCLNCTISQIDGCIHPSTFSAYVQASESPALPCACRNYVRSCSVPHVWAWNSSTFAPCELLPVAAQIPL